MACPYFMPVEKLENGAWPHPSRLPLGCGWSGCCTAPGHEKAIPAQHILEAFCNLGYATGCGWAPAERLWDSVRFAIVAPDKNSREFEADSTSTVPARTLRLIYVCEKANRPAGQGHLEFDLSTATCLSRHEDARIQRMAECFVETYLRKRS